MKKILIAMISVSYMTACAKSRPADENVPAVDVSGGNVRSGDIDIENPVGNLSDTKVPSADATLGELNASGGLYVKFTAMDLAMITVCDSLGYIFQVTDSQIWHKKESPGQFPYISDKQFHPGNPYNLGCDYMSSENLNGFTESVKNRELVLIGTEKLGVERLKLVPHASDWGIDQDSEVNIYESRDVKAIRFDFEYNQGENKFNFIREFTLN